MIPFLVHEKMQTKLVNLDQAVRVELDEDRTIRAVFPRGSVESRYENRDAAMSAFAKVLRVCNMEDAGKWKQLRREMDVEFADAPEEEPEEEIGDVFEPPSDEPLPEELPEEDPPQNVEEPPKPRGRPRRST